MNNQILRIILVINLGIAIIVGLQINFSIFKSLDQYPEENLSALGLYAKQNRAETDKYFEFLPHKFYNIYGKYTGINRASAFFSPNVGSLNYDFVLTSGGEPIGDIFESVEGNLRLSTFNYFLQRKYEKEEMRNEVIGILGKIVFLKNKRLSEIDGEIKIMRYPKLEIALEENIRIGKTESFDVFSICKL